MIKAVVFDFDGVIHNTFELGSAVNKIINPELTEEDYKQFFDGNLYEHKKITEEKSKKFLELSEKRYAELTIDLTIQKEIEKLSQEYKLFVITSNTEKIVKNYFENNKTTHLFEKILGLETHKSKKEKFKMLFKDYHLEKEEVIFVTDTLGDILEANELEIPTLAVDFGFHEKERLEKGNPLKIISNFEEIAKFLEEQKTNSL